jgi:hypothetical protein
MMISMSSFITSGVCTIDHLFFMIYDSSICDYSNGGVVGWSIGYNNLIVYMNSRNIWLDWSCHLLANLVRLESGVWRWMHHRRRRVIVR